MNRNKVWPWTFGVATIAVFTSGLAFNGPFDPELGFGGLRALMLVFGLAALVLAGVAVVYFGSSIMPTRHGLTWTPLTVAAVSAVSSAFVLRALEFNVHLYGAWVILFSLSLLVSGLGVAVLVSSALWGVVVRHWHRTPERGDTG